MSCLLSLFILIPINVDVQRYSFLFFNFHQIVCFISWYAYSDFFSLVMLHCDVYLICIILVIHYFIVFYFDLIVRVVLKSVLVIICFYSMLMFVLVFFVYFICLSHFIYLFLSGGRKYKIKPRHRYKTDSQYKTDPWYKTEARHNDNNAAGAVLGRFGRISAHNLGRAQIQ